MALWMVKKIRFRQKPKDNNFCPRCNSILELKYDFDTGDMYKSCPYCPYKYK
jgi:hypothetical protein